MVERTRELENSLGSGLKRVEANEMETVVIQRRAIRASRLIHAGSPIQRSDLQILRPCPADTLPLSELAGKIIGKTLSKDGASGDPLRWSDFE